MAARQNQASANVPSPQEQTVIGPGIRVNGRISGEEDLHVQGRVDGSIALTETLFVAGEGIVVAQVRARDVVVHGVIVGNVTAENSITLHTGGKLVGDLAAPRIIIADGAVFSGNVTMGEAPPRERERERSRASRPRATARPAATTKPAARTEAPPAPAATRPAPPARPRAVAANETAARPELTRVPPVAMRRAPEPPEDEVTVVVRHANLTPAAESASDGAKADKKAVPRVRVPKPGKRRVVRR